ncbi:hypothetical protein B0H14DRAFT_3711141 [Mycena olivaceomarginata]|nr:hypothetical protein B0H14DRAFT_3711141 [Mycena olivaceomarginata]
MQRSVSQVANELSSSVGAEASSPDTRTSPATAKRRSSFNIMKHVSVSKSIQSKTVPDTKRRSSLNVLKRLSVSKSTKPRNTVAEIFAPLCLALRPESPNHNSQCLPEIPHFSELVLPSSLNILNLATEGMAIDVNRNLEDEGGALSSALEAQTLEHRRRPWPKDPVISLLHPPRDGHKRRFVLGYRVNPVHLERTQVPNSSSTRQTNTLVTTPLTKPSTEQELIFSLKTQLASRMELCGQLETDLRARDVVVDVLGKKLVELEGEVAEKRSALTQWKKKVAELETACWYLEDEMDVSRQESMKRSIIDEASSEALKMLHRRITCKGGDGTGPSPFTGGHHNRKYGDNVHP